jgi:hypothetical protein
MTGAVVFGTADGFDWRGLGVLSQLDKSLVSLLDMRGGVLQLSKFEDDGLPAWFAVPLHVGAMNLALIGVVRPCRDATNRPGIVGAGVGLALRSDEPVVPRWRGRQAFALARTLIGRLLQGSGLRARIDFASWKWPESLDEVAQLSVPAVASQITRGAFRRQTIDLEWAMTVDDPAGLFINVLQTVPNLGPGLLIEAVNDEERRQDGHLTVQGIVAPGDDATHGLRKGLQEAQRKVVDLESQLRIATDQLRKFRDLEDKLGRALKDLYKAKSYAKTANDRIEAVKAKARSVNEKLKQQVVTLSRKALPAEVAERQRTLRALEQLSADQNLAMRTIARLSRTLQRIVPTADAKLLEAATKTDLAAKKDIEELLASVEEKKLGAALSTYSNFDQLQSERWPSSAAAPLAAISDVDDYDAVAPAFSLEEIDNFQSPAPRRPETQLAPIESTGDDDELSPLPAQLSGPTIPPAMRDETYLIRRPAEIVHSDRTPTSQYEPPTSIRAAPTRDQAPPRKHRRKLHFNPWVIVSVLAALSIVWVLVLAHSDNSESFSVSSQSSQDSSVLRSTIIHPFAEVCELVDGPCERAIRARLNRVQRAVQRMNADPSSIAAVETYEEFEQLYGLYDRASLELGAQQDHPLLSVVRNEALGEQGLGDQFLAALEDERSALTESGEPQGDLQNVSGRFADLQERFRRGQPSGGD